MSPIKGVSDIRRIPRLGKIHLGEKVAGQKGEYPRALDYFVCPPEVQAVYGDKPKVLDIMFPVADPNIFAPQWYKRYNRTNGLVCKGDGEVASFVNDQTGEMEDTDCVPDECEWYAKKHCRRVINLQFLLPKVPGVGVWQIDSTSFFSIVNINSNIDMIRGLCGRVNMIPLLLVLQPQEVAPEGKKKIVHIMNIIAPLTLPRMVALGGQPPSAIFLPPPPDESRPADLFPDGVLEHQGPGTFTFDQKQPEPPRHDPIVTPPPAPAETSATTSADEEPPPYEDPDPGPYPNAVEQATEKARAYNEAMSRLVDLWDERQTSEAKRRAIMAKPDFDPEKVYSEAVQALRAQRGAEASDHQPPQPNAGRGARTRANRQPQTEPPAMPGTPKTATPAVPPAQAPPATPRAFF